MTLDEFYGELKRVAKNYQWRIDNGVIRGSKTFNGREMQYCPLSAHYETCRNTGICGITFVVSLASDNKTGHDPAIRTKLLEVLDLKE